MVVHEDSLDHSLVSQLGRVVQTVIRINDTKLKPADSSKFGNLNKTLLKYHLNIDNKSSRNTKVITHVSWELTNFNLNDFLTFIFD